MIPTENIKYYATPYELDVACGQFITKTDRVLDVGCGIRPQKYFKPYLHVCLEPYQEYIDILNVHYGHDAGFLILAGMAQETLRSVPDKSFDSVFLIDVIEHIEKEDGVALIKELERVARKQVLLFTPLGFMPQHYEAGDTDAWGLGGIELQEHRSGWEPADFGDRWKFHVCKEYHIPVNKHAGEKVFGAFWAVLNIPQDTQAENSDLGTLFIAKSLEAPDRRGASLRERLKTNAVGRYALLSMASDVYINSSSLPSSLKKIKLLARFEKFMRAYLAIRRLKTRMNLKRIVFLKDGNSGSLVVKALACLLRVPYEEQGLIQ